MQIVKIESPEIIVNSTETAGYRFGNRVKLLRLPTIYEPRATKSGKLQGSATSRVKVLRLPTIYEPRATKSG